jgi:hypothetical protein
MSNLVDDGSTRRRSLLLGGGLGLFGGGLLGFSAFAIAGFVDAVARRVPIIMWDEGAWIALPVALALLALAAGVHIGRNHGSSADGRRSGAIRRLLILAVCLLCCAAPLPPGAHWIAARHLEGRGYRACGDRFWIAPDRMPDSEAALARCNLWRQA